MISSPNADKAFSWKALFWLLLFFWFFSTVLQAVILVTGYSGSNGIRDSLLYSSLWLIPVFLFPNKTRIIAAVIGIILWAASLCSLGYYIIYGQEFSQSVLFVMFESNTSEAGEYFNISAFISLFYCWLIPLFARSYGLAYAQYISHHSGVMLFQPRSSMA